jgi:hypothetical protein
MWSRALAFLREEGNRALLGWIGGGLAAAIGALWTAFVYFHPAEGEKPKVPAGVTAECGSVALGGDVIGGTITAGNSGDCSKRPAR